jgi:hypothetical protein
VERANQTLQDRLVKEMRLAGIDSIEAANAWLPGFIAEFNRRFAVTPASAADAHRPVRHGAEELALILSIHHARVVSKNLTLQCRNRLFQIQAQGAGYRLRRSQVTVCEGFDAAFALLRHGKRLDYTCWEKGEAPPLADDKELNQLVDQAQAKQRERRAWKPAPDHPWRAPLKASKTKTATASQSQR